MNKPRLIVMGPLPPPYHGVTVSTSLVLDNEELRSVFAVEHLDTSDHREGRNIGRWDVHNVLLGGTATLRLARRLGGRRGVVYLPLSQSAPGFLRDSLFIHVASRRGWNVAVHLRGSDFRAFHDESPAWLQRWIRATLRRVSSVAVMGESLRWVFDDLVAPHRIAVVPNGTTEPVSHGAVRGATTVLFLSNLRRRKGVVEALETAMLVLRREPSARFLFVGEWEDEQLARDLHERAMEAGDRIRFVQPVVGAQKDRLLASSAILLFPPVEPEGHPRVVLEAIAAGVPVVATRRGAIPETISDGEEGFLVDEAEPEALATRVAAILRDGALRERMSAAARRTYLANFTQERADRLLADWLWSVARS